MCKLTALLAASVIGVALAACAQSPTALTPDAAPRLDGHTFGPGHNVVPAGGHMFGPGHNVAPGGSHTIGSGHLTEGATGGTTVESDSVGRAGHTFGPGH